MLKNWKTTLAGVSAILTAVAALLHDVSTGNYSNLVPEIGTIVAGIGLLHAKDNNVTGGTISQ